jgi:putative chitinase
VTPEVLASCTGARIDRARSFAPFVTDAMKEFGIDTPQRQAAFLSQIGHESGGLRWVSELWGPTQSQTRYEGRVDLGNTHLGDGYRYRGRGLIQVTGRDNYRRMGKALGIDLEEDPELLSTPKLAARSAGCFWQSRGLNTYADLGEFVKLTRKINGGTNGLEDRQRLWDAAKTALKV